MLTLPDSPKKCKCGGTDFKQILNCFVCSKCDQHTVISAQIPSPGKALPLFTDPIDPLSLDTYTDEDDSVIPDNLLVDPVFSLYKRTTDMISSHILDFFYFFRDNMTPISQDTSENAFSFECDSPALPSSEPFTPLKNDAAFQAQSSVADIRLKFDCNSFSQYMAYLLCILIIPKRYSYVVSTERGMVPFESTLQAYSPQVSHPLLFIIFDCRYPGTLPDPLNKIFTKF